MRNQALKHGAGVDICGLEDLEATPQQGKLRGAMEGLGSMFPEPASSLALLMHQKVSPFSAEADVSGASVVSKGIFD